MARALCVLTWILSIACGGQGLERGSQVREPAAAPGPRQHALPSAASTPPLAPPAAGASTAPPAAPPLGPNLGTFQPEFDDARTPPPAITAELAHMQGYERLPALRRLPDFLSVNAVLALLPEFERDPVREQSHVQLEGGEASVLLGAYLDSEERLFVLWVTGNLHQALAVYEGPRLSGKADIQRGQLMLGHVLDESGDARAELIVEHITSMSVCCLPSSLTVYRVGQRGTLHAALTFPKSHAEVGPGVRWSFMNHFDFGDERVVVRRVFPDEPKRYDFIYDRGASKYRASAETRAQLEAERRARAAELETSVGPPRPGAKLKTSEPFDL